MIKQCETFFEYGIGISGKMSIICCECKEAMKYSSQNDKFTCHKCGKTVTFKKENK